MKKVISLFPILLLVFLLSSCGGSEKKPIKHEDPSNTEVTDTETETDNDTDTEPTETAFNCGNRELEEGEICDGNAAECSEIDPGYTGGYAVCNPDCLSWDISGCQGNPANPTEPTDQTDPTDPSEPTEPTNSGETENVFVLGPYFVNTIDVKSGTDGAPRDFRIYEPTGAEGNIPMIHFLHGFSYKIAYYDDFLTQLASHGFVVVSSQSNHGTLGIGGDTTTKEAEQIVTFLNWLKQNLQSKVSVTVDVDNIGISGHSRGGKVSNRVLNSDPTIAKAFFGVDPVDSTPPMDGVITESDPSSLDDPVQFKGESMFLGTEFGPQKKLGTSCAPDGDNSVHFYAAYPSPSHHIIAAGVGHADMVDPEDISSCGVNCTLCAGSKNDDVNKQFVSYTGGLMTAFFNLTLKCEAQYEALLDDVSQHPFQTTLAEHK